MHLVHGRVFHWGACPREVESLQLHGSYARLKALAAGQRGELAHGEDIGSLPTVQVDRAVDYALEVPRAMLGDEDRLAFRP